MLSELEGRGWLLAELPTRTDSETVLARYDGEQINAGLIRKEREVHSDSYYLARSGKFDVHVKQHWDIGKAQIQVERAEGYD